jgi:hypothetical protein
VNILENIENHALEVFKTNIGESSSVSFLKYYDTVSESIISYIVSSVKSGRSEVLFRVESSKFTHRNANPSFPLFKGYASFVVYFGENIVRENSSKNKARKAYKTASFISETLFNNPFRDSYRNQARPFMLDTFSTPFRDSNIDVVRLTFKIDTDFRKL